MIIKSKMVSSGGGVRAASYPLKQGDNERVVVLQDNADQLILADEFATLKGRKNGLIHFTINPGQEHMNPDDWERALEAYRTENGFNPNDPETLVFHESYRSDGTLQRHLHGVRTAADSETGKTYKRFRDKPKDEAVSRFMELELGHKLISGKFNDFAAMRMREMGHHDYADQIAALDPPEPAAFNHDEHQQAKRQSFDLPALRQQLKALAELPRDQQPQKLAELLDRDGLELADAIEEGRGRSRIMIQTPQGMKDHNANRTLKIKAAEVAAFIEAAKEHLHDLRSDTPEPTSDLGAGSTDSARPEPKPDHPEPDSNNQRSGTDAPDQQRAGEAQQGTFGSAGSSSEDRSTEQLANAAAELAKATANLKSDTQKFAASRGNDFTAADLDAPPDLSDPNLMKKLAAMLKKSLGGAKRIAAQVLTPNQGMPG
ncbi:hypothetical protein M3P21_15330 [Ruegeria sp. 2012CJ41-6]|uniref:Relaxase/mobilization nuclease domain-containing protein n=1 Tax=Ruegeria spongiae TaxID=2942209 RepID=A0ABT0Q4X1_9RHOB|nr:hypothetical protein [Ruegeria spongiae]MCL6284903.1 hypothetical protein [Ruegeria spongiae]